MKVETIFNLHLGLFTWAENKNYCEYKIALGEAPQTHHHGNKTKMRCSSGRF